MDGRTQNILKLGMVGFGLYWVASRANAAGRTTYDVLGFEIPGLNGELGDARTRIKLAVTNPTRSSVTLSEMFLALFDVEENIRIGEIKLMEPMRIERLNTTVAKVPVQSNIGRLIQELWDRRKEFKPLRLEGSLTIGGIPLPVMITYNSWNEFLGA